VKFTDILIRLTVI